MKHEPDWQGTNVQMPSKPILELSGITLRVGDRLLFKNTTWTFFHHQNWLLTGSNESGKTLLARAIAGEVPVVEGEIRYGFKRPSHKPPEECIVLLSFEQQKAAAGQAHEAERWFNAEASVSVSRFLSQELVEEINPFEVRPHREQTPASFRRHRQQVLDLLQISSMLRKHIFSLSNGEMRKVLIARALLRRPHLLILDDIFAGLDAGYRVHLKHILEELMKGRRVHILLIDSLPHEVPNGITHLLRVDKCRVAAHGPFRKMKKTLLAQAFQTKQRSLLQALPPQHSIKRAAEELVRLENVSVRYEGRSILSGIDWVIRRDESWAITGPNGSGKSTLLGLIHGDNPQAYANAVYLFGRRRGSGESVWEIKKRIGFISSELHLHFPEDQSCAETVISGFHESSGCFQRPSTKQRKIARRVLTRLGIAGYADRSFHSLSMGSQRMALLARALVKSPDLLLLDEPCHGLDFEHRRRFLRILESLLRRQNTTIVYVTHRKDEIPKGIRKLLELENGCMVTTRIIAAAKRKY